VCLVLAAACLGVAAFLSFTPATLSDGSCGTIVEYITVAKRGTCAGVIRRRALLVAVLVAGGIVALCVAAFLRFRRRHALRSRHQGPQSS
jgi:hypothetical protein